jgi:hypothetical protein
MTVSGQVGVLLPKWIYLSNLRNRKGVITMPQPDIQQIKIGTGGSILQSADNQQLLDLIRAAPTLSVVDLLKLAKWYRGGRANETQANYLVLFAIGLLAREFRDPQPDAAATPNLARRTVSAATLEALDLVEDLAFGAIDSEDKNEALPGLPNLPEGDPHRRGL